MRCVECIFWRRHNPEYSSGFCYRYPPKLITYTDRDGNHIVDPHRPYTEVNDYCGEFRDRPGK